MMIECPHCGQHYEVDGDAAGAVVTCENCKNDFTIHNVVVAQPQPQPQSYAAGNPPPVVACCRFCGGMIAPGEKRCRYCGKLLKKGGKPMIITLVIVGAGLLLAFALVFIFFLAVLLPALQNARSRAYAAGCVNNLKQIGMGIDMYRNDNCSYTPDLEMLKRGKYISGDDNSSLLYCPASKEKYVFLGGGTNMSKNMSLLGADVSPSAIPVVVERVPHNGRVNVLYAAGYVGSVALPRKNMTTREVVEFLLDQAGIRESGTNDVRKFRAKWLEDAEKAD